MMGVGTVQHREMHHERSGQRDAGMLHSLQPPQRHCQTPCNKGRKVFFVLKVVKKTGIDEKS